jgi:protein required for attachment to host cells
MQTGKTWILIADGGRARVLETIGIGNPLSQVQHMAFETELPPSRALGADQPGRSLETMGATRHTVGEKTDPHRELKRAFAQAIGMRLDVALTARAFARLVIVAPPVTLGDLRHAMSKSVSDHVAAEVAKDLVKVPNGEIRSHLTDVVTV